jgi:hypothetical protein
MRARTPVCANVVAKTPTMITMAAKVSMRPEGADGASAGPSAVIAAVAIGAEL